MHQLIGRKPWLFSNFEFMVEEFLHKVNIIEVCVGLVITLTGLAYPLLIQQATKIGDQYQSSNLYHLFLQEFPQKTLFKIGFFKINWVKLAVFIALFSIFLLVFQFDELFETNVKELDDNLFYIPYVLTIVSCVVLLYVIFIWFEKLLIYSNQPVPLLKQLKHQYEDGVNEELIIHIFQDFAFHVLAKPDLHLEDAVIEFYSDSFSKESFVVEGEDVIVLPDYHYKFVYELIRHIPNNKEVRLDSLAHKAVSGKWLLGTTEGQYSISETTYQWLWKCLLLISGNHHFVKAYWDYAHHYFSQNEGFQELNVLHWNQVLKQADGSSKEDYISFKKIHLAFGGLLYQKKMRQSLSFLLTHSVAVPEQQQLLPGSFAELLFFVEQFVSQSNNEFPFHFNDLNQVYNTRLLKNSLLNYHALLFIKLFAHQEEHQEEVRNIVEGMDHSENDLQKTYSMQQLTNALKEVTRDNQLLKEVDLLSTYRSHQHTIKQLIDAFKDNTKQAR